MLAELADRLGLTAELGRRANLGLRAGAHDRGVVLRDLAIMLADGGTAPARPGNPARPARAVRPGGLDLDRLEEQAGFKEVLARCPHLEVASGHMAAFAKMFTGLRGGQLDGWIAAVEADDLPVLHSLPPVCGVTTRPSPTA